jgi:hypothetical protein
VTARLEALRRRRDGPAGPTLSEKAARFERDLRERHDFEGLVLPSVLLPPLGRADFQTGSYENACKWTGTYVGAASLRYAVTKGAPDREAARRSMLALHRLQDITGVRGVFARGFKRADGPTWDEDAGGWPGSRHWWFQNGPYRWMGDVSKDQLSAMLFGYALYWDLVADAADRPGVADHVDGLMGRIVDHDMMLVDLNGQARNLRPDVVPDDHFGEDTLRAAQALANLKIAHRITGEARYDRKYRELIEREGYHRRLINLSAHRYRKVLWPAGLHYNDVRMGFEALYSLVRYEADPTLVGYYRRGLDRSMGAVQNIGNAFCNFVYHACCADDPIHEAFDADAIRTLQLMPVDKRAREVVNSRRDDFDPGWPLPIDERPAHEFEWNGNPFRLDGWRGLDGELEFTGVDFLLAYWMGRYHGFIPAEADRPAEPAARPSAEALATFARVLGVSEAEVWGRVRSGELLAERVRGPAGEEALEITGEAVSRAARLAQRGVRAGWSAE